MTTALGEWDDRVANVRIVRGVGRSPQDLFEQEEFAKLQPLPPERWDPVLWRTCKVARDFRIQFDRAFYSVPYRFIGKIVQVARTSSKVRIFLDFVIIAEHDRAASPWQYLRKTEHAPPHQEEYMTLTRTGIMSQAENIGRATAQVMQAIFEVKTVDGLEPARAALRLARKYSAERLEAACARALSFETPTYRSVKNILEQSLDQSSTTDEAVQLHFRFTREHGFFDPSNHENRTGENQTGEHL